MEDRYRNIDDKFDNIERSIEKQTREILLSLADVKKDTDINTKRVDKIKADITELAKEVVDLSKNITALQTAIEKKIIELEHRPLRQRGEIFDKILLIFLTALVSGLGSYFLTNLLSR